MKISIKRLLFLSLLIAWLLFIVIAFILVSRISYVSLSMLPDYIGLIESLKRISIQKYLFDTIFSFFLSFLFFMACFSLGLRIIYFFDKSLRSLLALIGISFIVGEILYSFIFLSVLFLYKMSVLIVGLTYLAGFLIGMPLIPGFVNSAIKKIKETKIEKLDFIFLLLICLNLSNALFFSSTRLGYDATAEYFSHAKIIALTQKANYLYPNNSIIVSAFHPGILFTSVIQIFGDQAARLISWWNGIIILVIGLAIAKQSNLSNKAQTYFVLLMITTTAFVDLLGDGKVELISTAPIIGAIYLIVLNIETYSKKMFLLIGVLIGFAIISRPYNIFLVVFFVLFFYLTEFIRLSYINGNLIKSFRTISPVFWMLPSIFIIGIFHLWQNFEWLGSALAPLEYPKEVDSSVWAWQFDPALLNILRFLYPLTLTIFNTPQSLGNISPFFIGFLPFMFLYKNWTHKNIGYNNLLLIIPTCLVFFLWITFFFTVVEIRYVFFLWIIVFIYFGAFVEKIFQSTSPPLKTLLHIVMLMLTVYMLVRTAVISIISYAPIDDKTGQASCSGLDLCAFFNPVNNVALPGDRVFVLFAYRYYLRPDLFACSSQAEEYGPLQILANQSPSDFWATLYQQGYRYIIFEKHLSEKRYQFGQLPTIDTAPEWLDIQIIFASKSSEEIIYFLSSDDSSEIPEKKCIQTEDGIWQVVPVAQ